MVGNWAQVCAGLVSAAKEDDKVNENFPFQLSDIKAWIMRKKDGTAIRFNVVSEKDLQGSNQRGTPPKSTVPFYNGHSGSSSWPKSGYSDWCKHTPSTSNLPIFEKDGIALYIADAPGARASYSQFDVAIDGGSVLHIPGEHDLPILYGDPFLKSKMDRYALVKSDNAPAETCRILKIRWNDRCAPPVKPAFWPALLKVLAGLQTEKGSTLNVLTICQGGHGRSGSALALLMMCLTDYTPLDALTHVRALHCARAIESKEQHGYLNLVAEHLKRDPDAFDAEDVKSFKDRFLTMDNAFAEPYKERVRGGKGAVVSVREGTFL